MVCVSLSMANIIKYMECGKQLQEHFNDMFIWPGVCVNNTAPNKNITVYQLMELIRAIEIVG